MTQEWEGGVEIVDWASTEIRKNAGDSSIDKDKNAADQFPRKKLKFMRKGTDIDLQRGVPRQIRNSGKKTNSDAVYKGDKGKRGMAETTERGGTLHDYKAVRAGKHDPE